MRMSLEFLGRFGFTSSEPIGFRMAGDTWNTLKVRRGATRARANTPILNLPQTVAIEYDRGRIIVAAAIDVPKKEKPEHAQLVTQITLALESLLARRIPPENAGEQLVSIEWHLRGLAQKAGRTRVFTWVLLSIFLALVLFVVIMAITSGSRR